MEPSKRPSLPRAESSPDHGRLLLWPIRKALGISFLAAAIGLIGLALLVLFLLPGTAQLHDKISALQLVFASVAGAGALVALVVAYRRQKVAEADSAHDRTRVFNERFTSIAAQLGDDRPAVRLAGVHAMAGLADDWEANRQTCVDVLCAYLRMPYEPDPGDDASAEKRLNSSASREVRHTVIRVITSHLREDAVTRWNDQDLDFTGVIFDGGDFSRAIFASKVKFTDAEFSSGIVWFTGAQVSDGTVYFDGAKFSGGTVSFSEARFSGGTVNFVGAKFSGATVGFNDAEFSGGAVDFLAAKFSSGTVPFIGAKFSDGTVNFHGVEFSGSAVGLTFTKFSGGTVDFNRAEFSDGTVDFNSAKFSGGTVDFNSAKFSGGTVDFNFAEFSGTQVDFSEVADWTHPPRFDWDSQALPVGVKLPVAAYGESQ